ncbi:MAG: hypothetical protein CL570_04765 [Alphaproteobacteria bacterium]|nr:hypothetical protein [Alphaproteobacteria bacterium]|tara:strand:- start:1873 stop:2493 length:621 start_codon:yes stop_codon:yes gene_type:complete
MQHNTTTALFTIILSAFTLASCGPAHQFNNKMKHRLSAEQSASLKIKKRALTECGQDVSDNTIPPRKDIMTAYNCIEGLVRQEMLPAAVMPELLLTKMATYRKVTVEYSKGNLSKEGLQAAYDLAEAQYLKSFKAAYQQKQAEAMQQQKEFSRKLNALGQSLRNQPSNTYSNSLNDNSCGALSLPPLAIAPCRYACVNGQWAKICN